MPLRTLTLIPSGVSSHTEEHVQHRRIQVPDKPSRMVNKTISVTVFCLVILHDLGMCLTPGVR